MELEVGLSNRSPYGFEKLNDGNYATWAFDVKYQFLKEKLWGLVSGTEVAPTPPARTVGEDEADETLVSVDTAAQAAYQIALSEWNDKINAAYLIFVTTIVGRLQAPVRQATNPADAWNRLRDLYAPSGLQRRFALSRQLYSLHKEPSISMQQHEITYDAIIEDLARAGKILAPEDLAITYLNTLPDTYSSLIQSMEPVLSTLTSQSIKAKVREEEQRLKNVANGNGRQVPNLNNVAANTAKSQKKKKAKAEQTSDSASRVNKKKDKCFHCGKLGHWENECRKRIAEKKAKKENTSTEDGSMGQGGAAVYTAGMAYVANMAVAEKLLNPDNEGMWCMDCGANKHMLPHKHAFLDYHPVVSNSKNVVGIGTSILKVAGRGNVKLSDQHGNFAIMQDVLHVPQLRNGLLSLTRASTEQGFDTLISGNSMIFTDGNVCIETDIVDGLCFTPVDQHNAAAHTATLKQGAKLSTWHERYGHAANSTIITLAASGNVEGLEILGNPKQDAKDMDVCFGCAMGKIHRSPFPSINNKHTEKGALIHSDTCGPMQVPSFGGNRYLITFIDDATRFIRGFLISNKKASTVLEAFKIFKSLTETKLAKCIQAIRTDNGTEYQGVMKDYLKDQGIEHQVTTPYSPESNGVAERYNRTIMEMVRPMLHHPGYPLELWGEAVLAACYLSNRLPSRALDGKTPFEA